MAVRLSQQGDSGTWMTKKIANAITRSSAGPTLFHRVETPVIEQRNRDQRLQQIVGERHAADERDRRDAPPPLLVAHCANDRRHVEDHDRDPAQDITLGGQDAGPPKGVATDWMRQSRQAQKPMPSDQADAERPPLRAANERQVAM